MLRYPPATRATWLGSSMNKFAWSSFCFFVSALIWIYLGAHAKSWPFYVVAAFMLLASMQFLVTARRTRSTANRNK